MKSTEFIKEDAEQLKAIVTGLIQQTDDEGLLHRVYTTLKSSDLTTRLTTALQKDADVGNMLQAIARVIVNTEGTVDEKMAFADNYSNGFIDVDELFSKNKVNYNVFVAQGFPQRVFDNLVPVIKQGVGPGELAFSIMSPAIRFTGQETGGGDLEVRGIGYVELKTEQQSGGRWINARKANMALSNIKTAIETASGEKVSVPRINPAQWIQIREFLSNKNPGSLRSLCKLIADSTFNHVDNTMYVQALLAGDTVAIRQAILTVGFANYKTYSGFDGLLIMSVPKRTAQYFTTIDELLPNIKADSPYIYAPESEMMPKVRIAV